MKTENPQADKPIAGGGGGGGNQRGGRGTRFSDGDGGNANNSGGGGGGGGNARERSRERRNCRVYVSNIPYAYCWQNLKDLFRRIVGSVEYVELFHDENGKALGCGIVEFKDPENVEKALEKMDRYEIKGRKLVVKEIHGEQRDQYGRIVRDGAGDGGGGGGGEGGGGGGGGGNRGDSDRGFSRRSDDDRSGRLNFNMMSNDFNNSSSYNLYGLSASRLESLGITGPLHNKVFVANLDYKVDSKKLKQVFNLAGKVKSVDLSVDMEGNSRGFAVVEYDHPFEAVQAISMLDQQMLYDRRMAVCLDRIPDKGEDLKLPEGLGGVGVGLGPNGEPLKDVARNLPNIVDQNQQNQPQSSQQLTPQQSNMLGNLVSNLGGGGGGGGNVGGMFNNSVQPSPVAPVVQGNKSQGGLGASLNLAALTNVVGGLGAALSNPLLSNSLSNLGLNLGQPAGAMAGGNEDSMSSANATLSNNYRLGGVGIGLGPNGEPLKDVARNLPNIVNQNQQNQPQSSQQLTPQQSNMLGNLVSNLGGGGGGGGNVGGMFNNSVQPSPVAPVVQGNKSQGGLGASLNLAALTNVVGGLGAALSNPLLSNSLSNLGLNLGQPAGAMAGGNEDSMSFANAALSNNYRLGGVGIGLGPNGEPLKDVARNLPNIVNQNQQNQPQSSQQLTPQQSNMLGNLVGNLGGGGGGGGNVGGMFNNSVQPSPVAPVVQGNKSQGGLGASLNLAALTNVVGGLGAALSNPLLSNSLSNLGLNLGQPAGAIAGGNEDSMSSANAALSNNYSTENNYSSAFGSSSGFNSAASGNAGGGGGGNFNAYNIGGGNVGGGNVGNVQTDTDFNSGNMDMFGGSGGGAGNASMGASARKSDTIIIKNLPLSCTWQTLRDKFRDVGEVKFAEIRGNDLGVVRFFKERDAELAIALMDGSRIDGRTVKVSFL